jgi:hypothetical protein
MGRREASVLRLNRPSLEKSRGENRVFLCYFDFCEVDRDFAHEVTVTRVPYPRFSHS